MYSSCSAIKQQQQNQINKQTTSITTTKEGQQKDVLVYSVDPGCSFQPGTPVWREGLDRLPSTRQPLKTTTTAAAVSRRDLLQMRDDRRAGYGRSLTKCRQVLTISSPCVDTNSKGLPKARLIGSLCGVLAESAQPVWSEPSFLLGLTQF